MKGVQCYELFGGIALKNHTFSFLNRNMSRNSVDDEFKKSTKYHMIDKIDELSKQNRKSHKF